MSVTRRFPSSSTFLSFPSFFYYAGRYCVSELARARALRSREQRNAERNDVVYKRRYRDVTNVQMYS